MSTWGLETSLCDSLQNPSLYVPFHTAPSSAQAVNYLQVKADKDAGRPEHRFVIALGMLQTSLIQACSRAKTQQCHRGKRMTHKPRVSNELLQCRTGAGAANRSLSYALQDTQVHCAKGQG